MIGGSPKLHYRLNRLGSVSSYHRPKRVRQRLVAGVESNTWRTVRQFPEHDLYVFSVDNLNQSDRHGVLVHKRAKECI